MSTKASFVVLFTRIVDPTAQQTADMLAAMRRAGVHVVDESIPGMILVKSSGHAIAQALVGSKEWVYTPVAELSA